MLKYFTILTEINFIWLGDVSQVTQWPSLMPSFLSNCWKKPERNSGFDGIRTNFSFPVCTCATVYLQSFLRMKKAIIVKGTIIYNNFLSKMVFLLSIRLCRFYREAWTEDREGPVRKIRSSSRPPTEVRGFHQTLKQKNKKQSNQKKNPSSHAGYQGIYSFYFKGFEITPREITLGRPFYSKWALTIIKQGCTHFPMNIPVQNIPSTNYLSNRKI